MSRFSQNRNTYVPKHVEAAMAKHMQRSMPAHMKKYIGPYMQQNMASGRPGTSYTGSQPGPQPNRSLYMPHAPRQTLFKPGDDPNTAQTETLFASESALTSAAPAQPPAGQPPAEEPAPSNPAQQYDFIMNPEKPARSWRLPGVNASFPIKLLMITGALLVLFIVLSFARGLIFKGPDFTSFITVAQDQQALIHLADNASKQKDLSVNNQNFAATAELSLTTAQSDLITYLSTNKVKVKPKALNLKVDPKLDEELTAAAAATTYNQTFKEIMKAKLNTYIADLEKSYNSTTGKKGRALLSNDYDQAKLLEQQLNAAETN